MAAPPNRSAGTTRRNAVGLILGAPLVAGCAGTQSPFSGGLFSSEQAPGPAGPQQQPSALGSGQIKVGLVLPLSGSGNAGVAAQSMRNAAELALAEFQNPNIQLLVKDDAGTAQGAQQGAQQALDEGAEIILGPLFGSAVPAAAAAARGRGVSVIAFSTDSSVAGRGVYSLSFLPESDVNRIVDYPPAPASAPSPPSCRTTPTATWLRPPSSRRWRAAAAASSPSRNTAPTVPDAGPSPATRGAGAGRRGFAAARRRRRDAGGGRGHAGGERRQPQARAAARHRAVDNPRVFASANLHGGLYAAPDPSGFRSFSSRYRANFGGEPVRTATLAMTAWRWWRPWRARRAASASRRRF